MSTTPYSAFLPEVMQYCPDVADFVAENAIKQACIEFCERTRYWQVDLDPQSLISGIASYEVDAPTGTKFVDVTEAWFNDVLLIPKSTEELTRIYRYTDWRSIEGSPQYITRIIPTELIVVPMPSETTANSLKVRASLAPTRDSKGVDSSLYEEFLEYISYGARARLYGTPKQPYYDKAAAMEYEKRFRTAISEVRTRVNRGLGRSAVRVEFARFA